MVALVAAALGELLALAVPFQHWHYFGGQAFVLLHLVLPCLVVADAVLQLGQLGLAVVQFVGGLLHFAAQLLLVFAGGVVVAQHFLVAKHVEHQAQQLARAEFAQAVGLALLQRQHFGDGRTLQQHQGLGKPLHRLGRVQFSAAGGCFEGFLAVHTGGVLA